jgi:hypothetical protein
VRQGLNGYPTDASLLWDTWRVAARLLKQAMQIAPGSLSHRFHDRKIKRLYLYVRKDGQSNAVTSKRLFHDHSSTLATAVATVVQARSACQMAMSELRVRSRRTGGSSSLPSMCPSPSVFRVACGELVI